MKSIIKYIVESQIKHTDNKSSGEFRIGDSYINYDYTNTVECPDEVDKTLYVEVLFVESEKRKTGIAKQLLTALIDFATKINYNIYLQASPLGDGISKQDLISFYKKMGFEDGGCSDKSWLIYVNNDEY